MANFRTWDRAGERYAISGITKVCLLPDPWVLIEANRRPIYGITSGPWYEQHIFPGTVESKSNLADRSYSTHDNTDIVGCTTRIGNYPGTNSYTGGNVAYGSGSQSEFVNSPPKKIPGSPVYPNDIHYRRTMEDFKNGRFWWEGVTSIDVSFEGKDVQELMADNRRYCRIKQQPRIEITVKCYKYPPCLDLFMGYSSINNVEMPGQNPEKQFGAMQMAFETNVYNDLGEEGKQTYIFNNLRLTGRVTRAYTTNNDSKDPIEYEVKLHTLNQANQETHYRDRSTVIEANGRFTSKANAVLSTVSNVDYMNPPNKLLYNSCVGKPMSFIYSRLSPQRNRLTMRRGSFLTFTYFPHNTSDQSFGQRFTMSKESYDDIWLELMGLKSSGTAMPDPSNEAYWYNKRISQARSLKTIMCDTSASSSRNVRNQAATQWKPVVLGQATDTTNNENRSYIITQPEDVVETSTTRAVVFKINLRTTGNSAQVLCNAWFRNTSQTNNHGYSDWTMILSSYSSFGLSVSTNSVTGETKLTVYQGDIVQQGLCDNALDLEYKFTVEAFGLETIHSNVVTILRGPKCVITKHPTDCITKVGGYGYFDIEAKNAQSYRLQYSLYGTGSWTDYPASGLPWGTTGATNHAVTMDPIASLSSSMLKHKYRYHVSGRDGHGVYSDELKIYPGPRLKIYRQPEDCYSRAGLEAHFSVMASNVASYQWQYTNDGTTWRDMTQQDFPNWRGLQTCHLWIGTIPSSFTPTRQYRCKLVGLDNITYYTDAVKINTACKIINQPENYQILNVAVDAGQRFTFEFDVLNAVSYQWYTRSGSTRSWAICSTEYGWDPSCTTYKFNHYCYPSSGNYCVNWFKCVATDVDGNTYESDVVRLAYGDGKTPYISYPLTKTPSYETLGTNGVYRVTVYNARTCKLQTRFRYNSNGSWTTATNESRTETISIDSTSCFREYRYEIVGLDNKTYHTDSMYPITGTGHICQIFRHPESITVSAGRSAIFDVVASNCVNIEWYVKDAGDADWSFLQDHVNSVMIPIASQAANGRQVKAICYSDTERMTESNVATITVTS